MEHVTIIRTIVLAMGVFAGAVGRAATVEFVDSDYQFSPEEQAGIKAIAESAVADVRRVLPQLPEDIRLTVSAGTEVIPQIGSTAQVLEPGHIGWMVDPSYPEGVTAVARGFLRSTLVHELHHVARMESGFTLATVMDVVVAEGLAVAFDRDFTGQDPALGLADYPDNVDRWVDELLVLPASLEVAFAGGASWQWMFRHADGRQWIAYRAGTYIVDKATKASGVSAAELVATPTEEILRLAGVE
jgi:hypothetical protein